MSSSRQASRKFELDCQYLHCCFSGNGAANNQKVVEILINRNLQDFRVILQTYRTLYNQDLLHVLSYGRRTNLLARATYLRMSEPQERDSEIVRDALHGVTVNLNTLIEIVCTRPTSDLQSIRQAYRFRYNSEIEQDIALKTSGSFKEILLAVLKSSQNNSGKVDMSMAMCDAKALYEAMESGNSVDWKTIITLIGQRTTSQIGAVLVSYKQLYGHEFSRSLKRHKCGQFGIDLRVVIRCIQNPEKFFAKKLRMTLKNGGIQDILIRVLITRAEIDIKDINSAFAAKTGRSLENIVRREFSTASGHKNNDSDKTMGLVAEFLVGLLGRS